MTSAAPPAAGHGRLILTLAVGGFASSISMRVSEPLVGVMARDLASDPRSVALLSTAFALPYALIQPVLGPIGDALGKERVIKGCLVVLTLALAASAFAPGLGVLFALRILTGAAAGGLIPGSLALLGDRVPLADRQVATSRYLVAVLLAQLVGYSGSGFLGELVGWRGVFLAASVCSALALAGAVAGFRGVIPPAGSFDLGRALAAYRRIIAKPRARMLFAFVFVEAIAVFGMIAHYAAVLEERGLGGPSEAGIALAGLGVGGIAYSLLVPFLLRELGLRRMLVTGGLLAAAALLTIGSGFGWRIDVLAFAALGVGFYMLHNSFQTQVTEVAPEARASAVALHAFSYFLGQSIGVVVLGFGLSTIGFGKALAACAVTILAVGLVAGRFLGAGPGRT